MQFCVCGCIEIASKAGESVNACPGHRFCVYGFFPVIRLIIEGRNAGGDSQERQRALSDSRTVATWHLEHDGFTYNLGNTS